MATVGKVLTKIFGSRNERLLKRYRGIVADVNALEPKVQAMTDRQLRERTQELREGLTSGKLRSVEVLPEAFAIMRESMDRHIGIRSIFNPEEHFDPDQLDDEMLQAYDDVQRVMITTGVSWQNINIPPNAPTRKHNSSRCSHRILYNSCSASWIGETLIRKT